jgi:hypothetical protein
MRLKPSCLAVLVAATGLWACDSEPVPPEPGEAVPSASAAALAGEPREGAGGALAGDGVRALSGAMPPLSVRRSLLPEEQAWLGREKSAAAGRPAEAGPSNTERTLAAAAAQPPEADFRVVVSLQEVAFDYSRLQSADAAARERIIAERQAALAPGQQALEARLRALGGRDILPFWLGNAMAVTVKARQVEQLARLPGVVEVNPDGDRGGSGAYSGLEARGGMLTSTMLSAGYRGDAHGRNGAGSPIRLGIIEWDSGATTTNWPSRSHVGWRDWAGGPTRLRTVWNCRSGTCVADTTSTAAGWTHGNAVMSVAAGSIEENQSATWPGFGTAAQQRRSGQAPEAEVYYYVISGCTAMRAALQRAVADGVDVANYSGWVQSTACETTLNCGDINTAVRTAMDAGMLFLACGGNSGSSAASCNLWYPGWRPDVLNVNGLDTTNAATAYHTLLLNNGTSSRGPMPIRTFGGLSTTMGGMGLSAPGVFQDTLGLGPDSYDAGSIFGCSFATPAVAGAAGLMRNALNALGWPGNNARILMPMMLLQGDGWNGGNPGFEMTSGISSTSGYGRVRMHWPQNEYFGGPWAWQWRYFTINQGETVSWPVWGTTVSAVAREWKWALTWFEDDLNNVADIDISVWDTCPPGGGAPVYLAGQSDYDLRNRIRLTGAQIQGRCLQLRAYGFNVPAGGRVVYTTDYYHSDDPTLH